MPSLKAIKDHKVEVLSSEIAKLPSTYVKLEGKQAQSMLKLTELLEDLDDVQNVWSNFDVSEEEIEAFHNA